MVGGKKKKSMQLLSLSEEPGEDKYAVTTGRRKASVSMLKLPLSVH